MKKSALFIVVSSVLALSGCSSTSSDNRNVKNLDDIKPTLDSAFASVTLTPENITDIQPTNIKESCVVPMANITSSAIDIEWYGACSGGRADGVGIVYYPTTGGVGVSENHGKDYVDYLRLEPNGNVILGEMKSGGEAIFRFIQVIERPGQGKDFVQGVTVAKNGTLQSYSNSPITGQEIFYYKTQNGNNYLKTVRVNDFTLAIKDIFEVGVNNTLRSILVYNNGMVSYFDSMGSSNMRPSQELMDYYKQLFQKITISSGEKQVSDSVLVADAKVKNVKEQYCNKANKSSAMIALCDTDYAQKNKADFEKYSIFVQNERKQRQEQIQLAQQREALIHQQQAIQNQQAMMSLNQSLTSLNSSLQQQNQSFINSYGSYTAPKVQAIPSQSPNIDHYRCQQLGSQTFCKQL